MALTSELLKPSATAALLGVKVGTLAVWRCKGISPPFTRIHRSIYYPARELALWIKSQPGGGGEATAAWRGLRGSQGGRILKILQRK
jgi:hypothetical protein